MRLLLFSDVHCDLDAARRLVEMARDVDIAVGAGDFATVRRGLDKTLAAIAEIPCPLVLVAGNSETDEELAAACRQVPHAHALHGQGVCVEGREFFGLGGAVPVTPFGDWSFDLAEEHAEALLKDCPDNAILVTHSPPYGVLDVSQGKNLGSRAIRQAILDHHPPLAVCGHIHSCGGQREMLGDAPVVNAGPQGIIWEL